MFFYGNTFFNNIFEIRAFWSQRVFFHIFQRDTSTFPKWTFINVQNRKTNSKPKNNKIYIVGIKNAYIY